jgi:hypothetical protein
VDDSDDEGREGEEGRFPYRLARREPGVTPAPIASASAGPLFQPRRALPVRFSPTSGRSLTPICIAASRALQWWPRLKARPTDCRPRRLGALCLCFAQCRKAVINAERLKIIEDACRYSKSATARALNDDACIDGRRCVCRSDSPWREVTVISRYGIGLRNSVHFFCHFLGSGFLEVRALRLRREERRR